MNYDSGFGERIKCSEKERVESLNLIKEILELSKETKTHGFFEH